jgi:hypothetical protein
VKTAMSFHRIGEIPPHAFLLDLPRSFIDWPSERCATADPILLSALLNDTRRTLDPNQCFQLARSLRIAREWLMAACTTLHGAMHKPEDGDALLNDWFGVAWPKDGERLTAVERSRAANLYKQRVPALSHHFDGMLRALLRNAVIFAMHPATRLRPEARELAFTLAGETMCVVYLEQVFDPAKNDAALSQDAFVALTIVHELSHNIAGTVDHRYGGRVGSLKVDRVFEARWAMENADSFAYFAADCASALRGSIIKDRVLGIGVRERPMLAR